ncbi:TetR/AcrR family transcriptional regulator [Brevibacterium sp. RIT 803]|uniref:TetR/AcrR family transcriptional regulator n=1 Tax=Brevibacterium sp. RIT 803 TaxID=2810210 RepID=UPI001952708F|nr:TetR/AcrR family transcriptional regulator [Brevibacterium sp. RIT 803]MBM6591412.1 TetR/AcrR family transcriptional regulator [Brevibacterium sp. RIT 803]
MNFRDSARPAEISGTSATGLWRGTSRTDRDGARRERLLEAALKLYGTLGFRGTSIQALCHESGVSSRSFYELFPARRSDAQQESLSAQESLLEQLYIVLNEEIGEAMTSLTIPAESDLLDTTVRIVSAALMPMLADERKARVLEIEAVGVNESLEARRRETMRMLAAAVDVAFTRVASTFDLSLPGASPRCDDGGLTSLIIVGGITEALVQRVHTPVPERMPTADFLMHVSKVALRAYGAGPDMVAGSA